MPRQNSKTCIDCGARVYGKSERCRPCKTAYARKTIGKPNPSGLCLCGCGQPAPIARKTDRSQGTIQGEPLQYISSHKYKVYGTPPPNPSRLCQCGCGETTPIARQSDSRQGNVAGEHLRYVYGHSHRQPDKESEGPNPSGLCQCGCGNPAPIARQSLYSEGIVRGKPLRFLAGHFPRNLTYTINADTGCWIWNGKPDAAGYGVARIDNNSMKAHRYIYEQHHGAIDPNLELDHLCRNRRCVNPDHLEPVTHAENVRRGDNTKLTKHDVILARQLLKKHSMVEVSRMLDIPYPNLTTIAYGYTWKDVE